LSDRLETSVTGDRISIGMTQQRLAEELGTVREVVSREIKNLVRQRILESLGGGRYRVVNAELLRQRAAGLGREQAPAAGAEA